MTGGRITKAPCLIPTLDDIQRAAERIAPYVEPSPVFELPLGLKGKRIFVKYEGLNEAGAFKLRGAMNAVLSRTRDEIGDGVSTVSSGNMAIAIAIAARCAGVPMVAYMYDHAPRAKIEGVLRHGGQVRLVSDAVWWSYALGDDAPAGKECFIYPVTDQAVINGHASIGIEIAEQLPEADVVLTPYGGGGLTLATASALFRLGHKAEVVAVEAEAATPVTAALAAGRSIRVDHRPTFVKSIGAPTVVDEVWQVTRKLVRRSSVVNLAQVVEAIQILFETRRLVAEGAAAASLASAIHDSDLAGSILCIISGANIDAASFATALRGGIPD